MRFKSFFSRHLKRDRIDMYSIKVSKICMTKLGALGNRGRFAVRNNKIVMDEDEIAENSDKQITEILNFISKIFDNLCMLSEKLNNSVKQIINM